MPTSATAPTVVTASPSGLVSSLLPGELSGVSLPASAWFVITSPSTSSESTITSNARVMFWPFASRPRSHVMVEPGEVPVAVQPGGSDPAMRVVPTGTVSVMTALRAVDGPLLRAVIVYDSVWPATTGSGASVLATISISASRSTSDRASPESLPEFGSNDVDATVATFTTSSALPSVPSVASTPASTVAATVTTTDAPDARVPMLQGSELQTPGTEATEPNVTSPGAVSLTTTPIASEAPSLLTVIV